MVLISSQTVVNLYKKINAHSMDRMTPEQFKEIMNRFDTVDERFAGVDRRFDSVESRISGVEKHLRTELLLKTTRLWSDFKDELRSVKEELLEVFEGNQRFTSDVNDRLSGRIGRVAAFVDMPTNMLRAEEDKPDETV